MEAVVRATVEIRNDCLVLVQEDVPDAAGHCAGETALFNIGSDVQMA